MQCHGFNYFDTILLWALIAFFKRQILKGCLCMMPLVKLKKVVVWTTFKHVVGPWSYVPGSYPRQCWWCRQRTKYMVLEFSIKTYVLMTVNQQIWHKNKNSYFEWSRWGTYTFNCRQSSAPFNLRIIGTSDICTHFVTLLLASKTPSHELSGNVSGLLNRRLPIGGFA